MELSTWLQRGRTWDDGQPGKWGSELKVTRRIHVHIWLWSDNESRVCVPWISHEMMKCWLESWIKIFMVALCVHMYMIRLQIICVGRGKWWIGDHLNGMLRMCICCEVELAHSFKIYIPIYLEWLCLRTDNQHFDYSNSLFHHGATRRFAHVNEMELANL